MDYGCLGSLITVALKYCKYLIEKSDQILGGDGETLVCLLSLGEGNFRLRQVKAFPP